MERLLYDCRIQQDGGRDAGTRRENDDAGGAICVTGLLEAVVLSRPDELRAAAEALDRGASRTKLISLADTNAPAIENYPDPIDEIKSRWTLSTVFLALALISERTRGAGPALDFLKACCRACHDCLSLVRSGRGASTMILRSPLPTELRRSTLRDDLLHNAPPRFRSCLSHCLVLIAGIHARLGDHRRAESYALSSTQTLGVADDNDATAEPRDRSSGTIATGRQMNCKRAARDIMLLAMDLGSDPPPLTDSADHLIRPLAAVAGGGRIAEENLGTAAGEVTSRELRHSNTSIRAAVWLKR